MNEELKVVISAEISDLKQGVAEAKSEVESFAKSGSGKFEEFNTAMTKVGDVSKNMLKVAAGAVAGAATALLGLTAATAEYRNAQAKLDSAFQAAGSNAKVAEQTYNDLYRVLGDGDVAVEAAGHLAKLTTNEKDLAEWTNICQGVYATFGDSIPIEGLTEAANETAKTGALTGSLADALNWAGESEEEFQKKLDACNTEAEREALIRETLTGIYDEAAGAYEKNAAQILAQNEAQAKMAEATAKLGEAMAPVNTMLTELGAQILADLTPYIQDFADNHLPQIQEALSGVGEKIGEVISWIADNWGLVSGIAAVVLGVATAISVLSTGLAIYNTVMGITAVVSAPVIGIVAAIVVGIAALIAIIIVCVKNWDDITAAIGKFAKSVGEFFSGLWDSITKWFDDTTDSIGQWWDDVLQGFSDWWSGIEEGWNDFWSGVGDKISAGVEDAKTKFEDMKTNVAAKVDEVKANVSEKFNAIKDTMGTIMGAAKDTVQEKLDNIKKAYDENGGGVKGIVAATMEGIKGFYTAGYTFINNLTDGKLGEMFNVIRDRMNAAKEKIAEVLTAIKKKFTDIWNSAKDTVKNAIDKIKGFMNFSWSLPKLKLPTISVSGKFSLNPPSAPKFSINWNALGGVFDKPTLFAYGNSLQGLGENGAEAVVPLEKNTKWLDRLAEMLAKKTGSTPIILQVDGKTFAQTSINSINQLTRQTGKLALNLG